MATHTSRNSVETLERDEDHTGEAFDSFHDGAHEIQMRAGEAMPATGRFLGRIVYNTSYAVSFGVSLPVMMIVRIIPRENALVHGFVDGAMAARDQAFGWHHEMMDEHADAEDDEMDTSANGTGGHDHGDSADHDTHHRRTRAKRSTGGTKKATRTSSRKKG